MTEQTDDLETRQFTPLAGPGSPAEPDGSENAQSGSEKPPELSNAQLIAGALGAGRDVFCMVTAYQTPKVTLSDDNCGTLGDAWGKVCDKRGWRLGGYLGDYMAEISAVMATVVIAKAVADGVKAEQAAREPVEVKATEPTANETVGA
jgi:hypothetical protein